MTTRWVFFRWKPGGRPWHEALGLYRVPACDGAPEKLSEAHADSLAVLVATGSLSQDEQMRAVSHDGDLYIINRATLAIRRLTNTRAAESSPVFGRDARVLYFLRDSNVYGARTARARWLRR